MEEFSHSHIQLELHAGKLAAADDDDAILQSALCLLQANVYTLYIYIFIQK